MQAGAATCDGCGRCSCCDAAPPGDCWCDVAPPDLSAFSDANSWSVCDSEISTNPGGTPPTSGQEVSDVANLEDPSNPPYLQNDSLTPHSAPTYEAEGGPGGCPAICFASGSSKAEGEFEILLLDQSVTDQVGLALIWYAPGAPHTLLIPATTDSTSLYWVWDDGVDLNISNGDGSIGYSTSSPVEGIHLLELVCDETNSASSIRLDGVDVVAPGNLWNAGSDVVLYIANVEVDVPLTDWCLLYAAWWLTSEGGGEPD